MLAGAFPDQRTLTDSWSVTKRARRRALAEASGRRLERPWPGRNWARRREGANSSPSAWRAGRERPGRSGTHDGHCGTGGSGKRLGRPWPGRNPAWHRRRANSYPWAWRAGRELPGRNGRPAPALTWPAQLAPWTGTSWRAHTRSARSPGTGWSPARRGGPSTPAWWVISQRVRGQARRVALEPCPPDPRRVGWLSESRAAQCLDR